MDLNILMKLMTAEQIDGKTLFYVNEDTLMTSRAVRPTNYGQPTGGNISGSNSGDSSSENPKQHGFSWPQIWKQVVLERTNLHLPACFQTQLSPAKRLGYVDDNCINACQRMSQASKRLTQRLAFEPKLKALHHLGVACLSARHNETQTCQTLAICCWANAMPFKEYLQAACRVVRLACQPLMDQRSKGRSKSSKDGLPKASADDKFGRKSGDQWSLEKIPLEVRQYDTMHHRFDSSQNN